jgi:hypothetical protein
MSLFSALPAHSSVSGINKDDLFELYSATKLFQEVQPFRKIDNSFLMRFGVRFSESQAAWASGAVPAGEYEGCLFSTIPTSPLAFEDSASLVPGSGELVKYVIVAGNTDYSGRGLYAYNSVSDLFLAGSNTTCDCIVFQVFEKDICPFKELQDVRDLRLPFVKDRDGVENYPRLWHSKKWSIGPMYAHGTPLGDKTRMDSMKTMPNAQTVRWAAASLKALCVYYNTMLKTRDVPGSMRHLGFLPIDVEFMFPFSSNALGTTKPVYAYVRVLMKSMPEVNREVSDPHYFPGGHCCFYCGASPEASADITDSRDRNKLMKCSRCLKIHYCSVECQKKDWKRHKSECN